MFENENYELWQGDCLKLMQNITDKMIGCIITDLPYGQTAIAAINTDRKVICIEKDKEIFNTEKQRVLDHVKKKMG